MDPAATGAWLDRSGTAALSIARDVAAATPLVDGTGAPALRIARDISAAAALLDRTGAPALRVAFDDRAGATELPSASASPLLVALNVPVALWLNAPRASSLRVSLLPLSCGVAPLRRSRWGNQGHGEEQAGKQQDGETHTRSINPVRGDIMAQ
jgi:hypothetical protein